MDVIVTTAGPGLAWSRQYCRRLPWTVAEASRAGLPANAASRDLITISDSPSRAEIVAAISRAARRAGSGGRILYNIGHGFGGQVGANVMFAPTQTFTVTTDILAGNRVVNAGRATIQVTLSADEADVRAKFLEIGQALVRNRTAEFVFLVCGVGANRVFLQQIKSLWGNSISVGGYADGIVLEDDTRSGDPTYPRTRLYLFQDGGNERDPANRARFGSRTSATPISWLEAPAGLVTV